jgi:hypothetical protein
VMFKWMVEVIPIFLFGWRDKDKRNENYYLNIFLIIINNILNNVC